MDIEQYKRTIEKCFPQFKINSIAPVLTGWDNFVLEVNSEYIFRFPKRPALKQQLQKEIQLLRELGGTLSVPVPRFELFWNQKEEWPGQFVVYRKIDGIPLQKEFIKSPQSFNLAEQLANFLTELHQFPLHKAAKLRIPHMTPVQWRHKYVDLYDQVQLRICPLLEKNEVTKTTLLWEDYLTDKANFRFKPVLLHGDLSEEHILCDLDRELITGIIDWGDACVGDPALDFAWLLDYGKSFIKEVLGSYKGTIDRTFLQRATFYSRIGSFIEILFGLDTGDEVHLRQGLACLRSELPAWNKSTR
jgi:aminoglycoside 2''-phosphotransferase